MLRRILHRCKTILTDAMSKSPGLPSPSVQGVKRSTEDDTAGSDAKVTKRDLSCLPGRPDRKRKVAMLLAYSGKNYVGMQINKGFHTVESEVVSALVKTGLIPEEHGDCMKKMKFQRAARTDKGVSAAGQTVSLNMLLNVENYIEKMNSHLPEDIRVVAVKRTTSGFDAKRACCARTYLYMIPTFAFTPIEEVTQESYRVPMETIDKVNLILSRYKGSRFFHNFTSGKNANDMSARRYIMEMDCGKPFERDGLEFATIKIKGQSFMIHQIRKMIGLMVAMIRGLAPDEAIERAWKPDKYDVPKAPGLGLMLDTVHYDFYNQKYENDGIHEALEWSNYSETVEKFKDRYIYPTIINTEKESKSMMEWLSTLPLHHYDVMSTDRPIRAQTATGKAHDLIKRMENALEASQTETDGESSDLTEGTAEKETLSNANTSESEIIAGANIDALHTVTTEHISQCRPTIKTD